MAAGDPAVSVRVAGEELGFRSLDARWDDLLRRRYAGFVAAAVDRPCLQVDLHTVAEPPGDFVEIAALLQEPPAERHRGGCLELESSRYRLQVDLERGRGMVAGPLHQAPLDLLLRLTLPVLLAADGLLLHGGLLVEGGRGWLFSGPSGAGKSTLARLLPHLARCDELAAVRRQEGVWRAFSLPFWRGRSAAVELAGVCLLRHGQEHCRTPLDASVALRRLAAEVQWPAAPREARKAAFERLVDLVGSVPVWDLAFRPSEDVWQVLSAPGGPP